MARRVALLAVALLPALAADALAGAGGGSSGFGGGGGGGGGSFGGGGSGGASGPPPPWWVWVLVAAGIAIFIAWAVVAEMRLRARRRARVRRTIAVAAEAAADDAWFEPAAVTEAATELFLAAQRAWSDNDRRRLAQLIGDDLMVEWGRRLDDFERKGWRNRVQVHDRPEIEYVGLVNREDDAEDRVVVRLTASMRDVVETGDGKVIKKSGESSETVAVAEYWTLARRDDRWIVVSIEQDSEGEHHLEAPLVPSPWSDEERLHDETALERAREDAVPAGVDIGELDDVDFADDARKRALDLSLVDERFAPHVLEAAARRAVAAWAEAVDGDDAALRALAGDEAVRDLLHAGDRDGRRRLVVRGPRLRALRIVALDPDARPPALTIEADLSARRYVEDRDTLELQSGSRDSEADFTERWTLLLDGTGPSPWRIAAAAPVG